MTIECSIVQHVSYESLDGDWEKVKEYSSNKYLSYERSRQVHLDSVRAEVPQSQLDLAKFGRHWVPPCGILPSTQAAVHKNDCMYCHGVRSECFPDGCLLRYYPMDTAHYATMKSIVTELRDACGEDAIKNELDPMTGTSFSSNPELVDKAGRHLL